MPLAKANHAATLAPGVQAEIYKTALRAFVNVEPQQLDKASAAMDALERVYARDPEGAARLTQMLVSIAFDLQQQLEELGKRGDSQGQTRLLKSFDKFLSRITARSAGTDFKTLNWGCRNLRKLAGGLNQTGKLVRSRFVQSASNQGL